MIAAEYLPTLTFGIEDRAFNRWACSGLVWLPAVGMGYYPVEEAPYDAEYFAKYERYAATDLGRRITQTRVDLVIRHLRGRAYSTVDVGIGCGAYIEAAGGRGFDINPAAVAWLEERGRFCDPRREPVDVLTFWDSLEHIPEAASYLIRARDWVFCSLPIVPGDGPPRPDWKHFRRDEHCWFWTRAGFLSWMAEQGFECVEHNTAESLLGREDIHSFAFRRIR